jgi:hypothetical protein
MLKSFQSSPFFDEKKYEKQTIVTPYYQAKKAPLSLKMDLFINHLSENPQAILKPKTS